MQQYEEMNPYKKASIDQIRQMLGEEADYLLHHRCEKIPKESLYLPGPDFIERVVMDSDRPTQVLRNLKAMFYHGRLSGTGYLSILPVDQGVEHSAAASFTANPLYFDPEYIVELAIKGGCNAVASTLGVLGAISRKYAHKIPFIVKINHNELLTYPNTYDQIFFADVDQAWELGAAAVGCTIYFGSQESDRQIQEVSQAFKYAHELGMATILWCYLRNPAFKVEGKDYHTAADLTGQANHLGVTIEADIVKQKQPTLNGGYLALNKGGVKYGKIDQRAYTDLTTDHPIDLTRYQVAHCYMGRAGLINSGGASGDDDFTQAVRTAVINKRAGGTGLISGRKAFQRPMEEGIKLLHSIQDVYLCPEIEIA
jgi:class I fructose-bisphosphate aldolase